MNKTLKLISLLTVIGLVIMGTVWFMRGDTDDVNSVTSAMLTGHHGDDEAKDYEIYPGDVVASVTNGEEVILLDVRTPSEYEEVHLKNALLLPVQELSQQSLEAIGLGADAKDKEIILYCRSGARSQTAYNIMTSLGYTNVKSVAGGMIHWEEDNYPLTETGPYLDASPDTNSIEKVVTETGPKITLDRTLYNFGQIAQSGGTVETKFPVRNTGTEVLEIGTLTTSCSCTSASISTSTINPGETAILTVVFDPDFHAEPLDEFKRTVFIPTNDTNNPEAEVAIQVDILEGE